MPTKQGKGKQNKVKLNTELFDHFGNPLSDVLRRDKEVVEKAQNKIETVFGLVDQLKNTKTLVDHKFVIIATNIFVATEGSAPIYLPAEVSMAKFSLGKGIEEPEDVYHAFPEPGPIPLGYRHQALQSSECGHQVPIVGLTVMPEAIKPGVEVPFQTMPDQTICAEITRFLAGASTVFCLAEVTTQCEAVMITLAQRTGSNLLPTLSFLPLHVLLHRLAPTSVPSLTAAEDQLERDRFVYNLDLLCPWHSAYTDVNCCTSAVTKRLAYTVMDLTCRQHGVSLVPGHHLPPGVETDPQPLVSDMNWGKEERQPDPGARNWFPRTNYLTNSTGFSSTDVRLRHKRAVNPLEREEELMVYSPRYVDFPDTGYSAGTISEFLGDTCNQSESVVVGDSAISQTLDTLTLGDSAVSQTRDTATLGGSTVSQNLDTLTLVSSDSETEEGMVTMGSLIDGHQEGTARR